MRRQKLLHVKAFTNKCFGMWQFMPPLGKVFLRCNRLSLTISLFSDRFCSKVDITTKMNTAAWYVHRITVPSNVWYHKSQSSQSHITFCNAVCCEGRKGSLSTELPDSRQLPPPTDPEIQSWTLQWIPTRAPQSGHWSRHGAKLLLVLCFPASTGRAGKLSKPNMLCLCWLKNHP